MARANPVDIEEVSVGSGIWAEFAAAQEQNLIIERDAISTEAKATAAAFI